MYVAIAMLTLSTLEHANIAKCGFSAAWAVSSNEKANQAGGKGSI